MGSGAGRLLCSRLCMGRCWSVGDLLHVRPQKARGHRQKGAGTVVTSRGEVTAGGMVLKEWMRTPVQLLHEWSQSQKRPRPR